MRGPVDAGCRDCAEGGPGGPGDYRYTIFDDACPACREQGQPQIFVNTATLALYVRVVDLTLGDGVLTLERSHNLDDTQSGPFGPGWTFNLNETVTPDAEKKVWTWRRASGRLDRFSPAIEPGRFFAITNTPETLTLDADGALRAGTRVFRADGRLLSLEQQGYRITVEYDAAGRLSAARALGRSLQFQHEGGRIVSVTDSAGRAVRYSYTPEGRLAAQINTDGEWVAYQYDPAGRLSSIALPNGAFTITYNDDAEYPAVAAITLPGGAVRRYEPGRSPRQVRVTDDAGGSTLYTSNALGLVESITDAAGNRAAYVYDSAGRRTRTLNANGETSRFDYDAAGNLVAVLDGAGARWTADYDPAGRLTRITDPNGNAWQFRHDALGRLEAAADPLGAAAVARRNAANRITALADGAGNSSTFEYDSEGLLTRFTDALGASWTYSYDRAARIASVVTPSGAVLTAEYDARNRLAAAVSGETRAALAPTVARDALNRITGSTDSFGNELGYSYDAAGRLAELRLPSGTVRYQYDRSGRLSKVADWAGNFALYRYDAAGAVVSISVSGGPVTAYQYDAARSLRAIVSTGAGGDVVAAYRYVRDGAGNRTGLSAAEPSSLPVQIAGARISYDAANRVVSRDDGCQFRYGAAGNLVAVEGPRGAELSWDAFGRLVRFASGGEASYRYDAAGLRVERRTPGSVRRYVYDLSTPSPRLVMETNEAGAPLATYVYGLGLLWKVDAAGRAFFYHFDAEGNTVAVSTAESGVLNRYRYDPLGRLIAAEEAVENLFRARGESGWVDDGDGLLYGGGAYHHQEYGLSLAGSIRLAPPRPAVLPRLRGAASCFIDGVAECALGERTRR